MGKNHENKRCVYYSEYIKNALSLNSLLNFITNFPSSPHQNFIQITSGNQISTQS